MHSFDHPLLPHYDAIWARAEAALRAGDVELETHLPHGADPRRGLTLIARPDAVLIAAFERILDRLETAAGASDGRSDGRRTPGPHRYPGADMHVTILSLFTVGDHYRAELGRIDAYRAAVRAAVGGMPPFEIDFRGVTASRGAVLAQGFPRDATLDALRERLRDQLRARALDASLDQRYKLVTAHTTLLRFTRPLADPGRLADAVAALRDAALGTLRIERLALVQNDWYMSRAALQEIESFALNGGGP